MAPTYPQTAPLQQTGFAIIVGLPLLAACFVGVRLYARRRLRLPLDWDDYVITVASVLSIALIYPSYRNMQMWHFGLHIWQVDQRKLEPDLKEYHRILLAFNMINTPILPLVKASILLLLLKVGKLVTPIRRAIYVFLVFIAGACIGPWVAMIFMCEPRTGRTTSKTVFGGLKCMGIRPSAIVYLWLLSVNIFTDILILPIPNILMSRVKNTTMRARMTVFVVSLLMLGATGIAIARFAQELQHQLHLVDVADWTYTIRYTLHHAENNVAIMLACMPMLRTLIIHWRKTNFSQQSRGSSDVIASRKIQRESALLQSWDGDGIIDPAPLEKKETIDTISEDSMVELKQEAKTLEEGGSVFSKWKGGAIGLTIPKPVVRDGKSEPSQTRYYDSE